MTQSATPKPDLAGLIRGRSVALAGRLASMSKEDFIEIVECHGGAVVDKPGAETVLFVLGQRDLPLQPAGTLQPELRRALKCKDRTAVGMLTEDAFLQGLGLEQHRSSIQQFHSTSSLTEALGLSRDRIVAWVNAGLIKPAYTQHGISFFEFRQVSVARMLCEMAKKGVSVARLRKSLEDLKGWMPEVEQPLESLTLLRDDGRLLVRLADGDLAGFDGQLHFDFSGEPDAPAMRITIGPKTAMECYEAGVEQESAGYYAESEMSYREALKLGGTDARISFGLANALVAQGMKESAIERYRQAVEINPQFAEAWNNLGTTLSGCGRLDAACAAFREAIEADPDYATAHYNLADALDDLGRCGEAAVHWRAYLRFDNQSAWAKHARQRVHSR